MLVQFTLCMLRVKAPLLYMSCILVYEHPATMISFVTKRISY